MVFAFGLSCQLTIEGPGANANQVATIKTFRQMAPAEDSVNQEVINPVEKSDGIRLFGEYILVVSSSQSIDLSLTGNAVSRLSGNSVLDGSTVEVDNAEWQLFPDVSLGSAPTRS